MNWVAKAKNEMMTRGFVVLMAIGVGLSKLMLDAQCFWFFYEEEMDDDLRSESEG